MSRFDAKVAIVTGGASGIGADAALRFAREGAAVTVADLNEEAAQKVAGEIEDAGGRALAYTVDVSSEDQVAGMIDATVDTFGTLDILVNNAGIGEDPAPFEERTADSWQRIIDVNLSSVFYGIKHATRVLKAEGKGGVVVNVSSILGLVGFGAAPSYSAAKHGVVGLTKSAALELAPAGIRVVAVNPAFIRTPLIEGMEDAVLPLHPIGRLGESEEVASLILYLASDEAGFMTGATYLTDGGYTAQ